MDAVEDGFHEPREFASGVATERDFRNGEAARERLRKEDALRQSRRKNRDAVLRQRLADVATAASLMSCTVSAAAQTSRGEGCTGMMMKSDAMTANRAVSVVRGGAPSITTTS